jgi:hypothetical protein
VKTVSPVGPKTVHRTQNAKPANRDHLADTASKFPKRASGSFCFLFLEHFCLEHWGLGTLQTQGTKQPTMQRLQAM